MFTCRRADTRTSFDPIALAAIAVLVRRSRRRDGSARRDGRPM
jgi:hypothetical protein